jgi:diketogulonate reductase-like aldo/keto reductase
MAAPLLTLNDGQTLPWIGFGTYPLRGNAGHAAVKAALTTGFRLLDSAVNYRNEVEVGRAIREFIAETGTSRDEIVVQTKIPGPRHAYADAIQACQDSVELLGLERIDVVLLHSPNPTIDAYRECWKALVDLRGRGVVRSIGVSNVAAPQLATLIDDSGVVPAIGQIDMHPYSPHAETRAEFARLGIVGESWSPLGGETSAFSEPAVSEAATARGVTPAQIVLRWHLQSGSVPLPMSAMVAQQREYLDVFGFELTPTEMAEITALRPVVR